MREREHKLLVDDDARLPPWDELLAGLGEWSVEEVDQEARYFDTEDLRLTRAGVSMRYRSDDGWTVKLPAEATDVALAREEIGFPGGEERPPPDAVNLVRAWTRAAQMRVAVTLRTHRTRARLRDEGGRARLELDDDRVSARGPRVERSRFREIEVELADADAEEPAAVVVSRLHAAGARERDPMPKVARALGRPARAPADLPELRELRRNATVEDLVRHALVASTSRLVHHDPLVRLSDDPEPVHQARVATRRLRSDLRTLAPVLDREWAARLRDELHWLGDVLGGVRDADVLETTLRDEEQSLPPADRVGVPQLLAQITATRDRRRAALVEALDSRRYALLLDDLVAACGAAPVAPSLRKRKARPQARRLARRAWRKVRRSVRGLPGSPEPEDLHRVRKRAKQGRYALELLAPVLGKDARTTAARLEDLQEILGSHHDAVVAHDWLHDVGRDSATDGAYAAGALAGALAQHQERLAGEWRPIWRRAKRRARSLES